MPFSEHDLDPGRSGPHEFATTHWSAVLEAQRGDPEPAARALEMLCRAYWWPIYAFVRRRGFSVEDAQDLTQEFFTRLLQRDFLKNVAREKGRFRSFLLATLKNFLATEWRRADAAKRGGGRVFVSWEEVQAEERLACEPAVEAAPEELYEREWAVTAMEQAVARLREEFQTAGKGEQFARLLPYLSAEGSQTEYAAVAGQLGMSPGAVKVAVHRFRRGFTEALRRVIAHTVAAPGEVEEELQALMRALQHAARDGA